MKSGVKISNTTRNSESIFFPFSTHTNPNIHKSSVSTSRHEPICTARNAPTRTKLPKKWFRYMLIHDRLSSQSIFSMA